MSPRRSWNTRSEWQAERAQADGVAMRCAYSARALDAQGAMERAAVAARERAPVASSARRARAHHVDTVCTACALIICGSAIAHFETFSNIERNYADDHRTYNDTMKAHM